LKEDYKKEVDKVRKIASQIKETMLSEIASEFTINLIKSSVEVKLNKDRMKDLSITPLYLEKTVSEALKGINVKLKEDIVVIKPKTESTDIKELYKLKEKAKSVHIKGISGITQVLPVKIGGEFIILCAGSNIKEALQIKEVDETRIKSNDIFEVLEVFGIEAARQTIINEALKVIENQGLDIDIRHVMFMADVMTTTGKIKGITRSGITSEKESVLARASFETPLTHLINASLVGEVDELNSVVENVMLNQAVPLGTGLPGLLAKMLARVEKEDKKNK
ncbi:MAG TPA: intein-containing DNA-directed RNA polymerase subunit A'', partial [Candidatus Nanoarchaeia archaeon]|nr:intein-containing DNA-directed RNA polymerase subunit A'' [Candidatus Nanoarchaeia archaeon]